MITPGTYQHYKGKQYQVISIAHHSETLEEFVVYQALYNSPEFGNNSLWIRPLKMFEEEIEIDGQKFLRFTRIN